MSFLRSLLSLDNVVSRFALATGTSVLSQCVGKQWNRFIANDFKFVSFFSINPR